jgi:type III restriction enzyme
MSATDFGLSRQTADDLRRTFATTPQIETVWIFGSRARGDARPNSDIDIAVDAPRLSDALFQNLQRRLLDLPTLHKLDVVHWQSVDEPVFRAQIERDRRPFWTARRGVADAGAGALGTIELKEFQQRSLAALADYVAHLKRHAAQAEAAARTLRAMEGMEDAARQAADFPAQAWRSLRESGRLPPGYATRPHSSRWDGAGRPIPNVCLKVPTGGGKTLLAAAGIARILGGWRGQHAGLVLWVVPNEAIYRQTLAALSDRDHPYRQLLNVAGAGRVKILEKDAPLTRLDVESKLCVMLLMLQAASRQNKQTLRVFKDRGNVLGFLPREDDLDAHWALLHELPNLDAYAPTGLAAEAARAQKGSIVKSSLGNVLRLLRPVVVIDEGHHAYSETALKTIDGFNPCFMLELSATPRVAAAANGSGSNILVDVRGTDLDEAEMIKLPIHVDVTPRPDWQSCLAAAVTRLDDLQREADLLRADTARYIRPILLVQVERTGAEQRQAGFIHADDALAYLRQLGFGEGQVAIKTSERNDLGAPENIDLLDPSCRVRAIITKQALQEGWDCPFAYVLCALAAGRQTGAMTQLVGRVLRQPQTAKTGRAALDACYVLCHDARTGEVVRAIKKSLEGEGMGDLGISVTGDTVAQDLPHPLALRRRSEFAGLRIFVPLVTVVEPDGRRRPLDYDSDVLGALPWHELRAQTFAADWAPDAALPAAQRFTVGLDILQAGHAPQGTEGGVAEAALDPARLVRSLVDIAPNAWWVWQWVSQTLARLRARGHSDAALARSTASLTERLRADLEAERDRLAETVFEQMLADGRIEFRLRADSRDYALPQEATVQVAGTLRKLRRPDDDEAIGKSLLEPALKLPDLNDFEVRVAGYLDQQAAVRWWHRNVAKAEVGLQGWKRHKVYPDFVFAVNGRSDAQRIVLLETKGLHLQGEDTAYKRRLLERLTSSFSDERGTRIGSLELATGGAERVVCDLVFDAAWQGSLAARYFSGSTPS